MKSDMLKKYMLWFLLVAGSLFTGGIVIMLLFRPESIQKGFHIVVEILAPFIYGFVIAYLINPICDFFERHLTRLNRKLFQKEHPSSIRMISVFLALAVSLLVVCLLFVTVLPRLITSVYGILATLPGAVKDAQTWLNKLKLEGTNHVFTNSIQQMITTVSGKLQDFLESDLLPSMTSLLSQFTLSFMRLMDLLKNFGIGCIVAVYLLGSKEKFMAQGRLLLYSVFNETWAMRIRREIQYTDQMFSGFIHGKLFDSLIIGGICFLFTWITGTPYALLVSIIVGVTNLVPFFGPYLGAIPSTLLILTVSPVKCLVFLVFIIILQQVDGNIIGPRILGDKMGLSGFWVLFSILFFGSIWGLVGMLIGVPVFAVIYDLIRRLIILGLNYRKKTQLLDEYEEKYSNQEDHA